MKIELTKPSRTFVLGIVVVIILLGAGVTWRSGLFADKPPPTPEPAAIPGEDAVRAGVEAFCTVDFSKGKAICTPRR